MRKLSKIFALIAVLMATLSFSLLFSAKADTTIAATTTITLEAEYVGDNSIRYISKIYGIDDANKITSTTANFALDQDYQVLHTSRTLNKVYKSVSGKYEEKDGILYQVVTLNNTNIYLGYYVTVNFEYTFSDGSTSKTASLRNMMRGTQSHYEFTSREEEVADIGLVTIYRMTYDMDYVSFFDLEVDYKSHNSNAWNEVSDYYDFDTCPENENYGFVEFLFDQEGVFDFGLKSINVFIGITENVTIGNPTIDDGEIVLDFATKPFDTSTVSYTATTTAESGKWSIQGFNSNNNSWNYVKMGGKNGSNSTAYINLNDYPDCEIEKVILDVNNQIDGTYTDVTLEVTAEGEAPVSITKRINAGFSGQLVFDNGDNCFPANSQYLLLFDAYNQTDSNGSLILDAVRLVESRVHHHKYVNQDSSYVHLFSEATCTEPAYYYYSCSCGAHGTEVFAYGEPEGHVLYSEITVAPTDTTQGERTYYCQYCNYSYTEVIPSLGDFYPTTDYDDQISTFAEVTSACSSLANNKESTNYFYIRGYVEYNPNLYGNTYLVNEVGDRFQIYGMYDHTGVTRYDSLPVQPQADDFVILYGKIKKYNYNLEMINARLYWLNDDDMTGSTPTPGDYTITITKISQGTYDTGNYDTLSQNGYEFVYFRAYGNTLLDNSHNLYDSLEGSFYNACAIRDMSSISLTYTSSASFTVSYSEDYYTYTPITVSAGSNKTINLDLYDADYFKIETGTSDVTISSITIKYQYTGTDYPTYRNVEDKRINPTKATGTLVAGSSYVDVPIDVTYNNNGTYTVNQTKRYTYYTLDYVESHPSVKAQAAMTDPVDVINYYTAFNTFPANYVYISSSKSNTANYSQFSNTSKCTSVFSTDMRYISYYTRTDGYATSMPGTQPASGYYELDIALDNEYPSPRGVGRVVVWTTGINHTGYDSSPVCVYTDDHYMTFQEYMNDGTFSVRFCAEGPFTCFKYSNTVYPTTYTNI